VISPVGREKTRFGAKKAPSQRRKSSVDQQLGYDLERPAGSGIRCGRQRIGSGLAAEFGNAIIGLGYSHKYDFGN
jgi:hypothetical protein